MENLDIKNFQSYSSTDDQDNVLIVKKNGTDGRINIALLRDQLGNDVKPSIVDGMWYIGKVNTGVKAEGETPVFRASSAGVEWKYEKESDNEWRPLFGYEALKFEPKFSDLIDVDSSFANLPDNTYAFTVKDGILYPIEASSLEGDAPDTPVPTKFSDLTDVDSSFADLPDSTYAFVVKNGILYPIEVSSLGGGSSTSLNRLSFIGDGVLVVAQGSKVELRYNFTSTLDGMPTGPGTATYTVNNRRVHAATVAQGDNALDITTYLMPGANTARVEVTDSYGNSRQLNWSIETVNISLTSTFDASQIFSGAIAYRYTPVGNVAKTVHFLIDGHEVDNRETSESGRQQTQTLPAQPHGNHTLEVYITALIGGVSAESNHLYYDLVCYVEGETKAIIASTFQGATTKQYSTLVIPYLVYSPASSLSQVELLVNNQVVSTLEVGRTLQTWNYRVNHREDLTLAIRCGTIIRQWQVAVEGSVIDVEAETANLELHLASAGRSNSEINRDSWTYGNVACTFSGFNWQTNGWIPDANNNVVLRLSGDARVHIPLKVFATDIRSHGKTIELEFATSDVTDYEAIVANCFDNGKGFQITAQNALFAGTQTKVEAQFKEEERLRISFVVEELAQNRLLFTYINGIASGVRQYQADDSFTQNNPVGITLGSNFCTLDIYNMRVYDNNLNQYQILDNYIADMDDTGKKIELYEKNQVYDSYGNINYIRVLQQIPCMTLIGDLPAYKGDKKTISVRYENLQEPEKSFTATGCQIDVQGTSSQYYPRKNYKTNFKGGFTLADGTFTKKYQLNNSVLPASVFCEKADFAESSGTHNTGLANLIESTLKKLGFLTPPQIENLTVRTTVAGFPMIIFHQATEDAVPEFVGKYNFNTDKAAEDTFGFTDKYPNCECIEFCNNTSPRVRFYESDYSRLDEKGKPEWLNDFEFRYPDDDDLNAEYEAGIRKPLQFKRLTDWIVSCIGKPEKFKEECADYFNLNFLTSYYIITELLGMVDQRAKNMFFTTWDGQVWYPIFYDNDTCLGINNEGAIAFSYNIECHDTIGTQNVWNGADSALWLLVEQAFPNELAAIYQRIRTGNILSYEEVYHTLNAEQSEKWSESIYNADGLFKYITPLTDGYYDYGRNDFIHTGEYLYALQGSRAEHRKWWVYNRFRYMDSKYDTGNYVGDHATMRLYTPTDWAGVKPDADFHLTAYADQYLKVKYGSYETVGKRGKRNEEVIISAPAGIQFNDTETIIYGASRLKSIGDLSGKYAGTIDMSRAVKLEELLIGSKIPGYKNTNLHSVTVKSNTLLRRINVENCPALTQPLDVSGCLSIEEIYAEGSGITGVTLPAGGNLRILKLPATVRSLRITNQERLTDEGFSIEGVNNLITLVVEKVGFDVFAFLDRCMAANPQSLERIRLIDVQGTIFSTDSIFRLTEMGGIDANGQDIQKPVVTGKVHALGTYKQDYDILVDMLPELTITYDKMWVKFADPFVKQKCVSLYDKDKDGEILEGELIGVTYLPNNMFKDNQNIQSFDELKYFQQLERIDSYAFQNCGQLKSIQFATGLKHINQNGFQKSGLVEAILPDSTTTMTGGTFRDSANLKHFVARGIKDNLADTFRYCSALEEVVLTGSYTEIGGYCFQGCSSLQSVTLANTCTNLGSYSFAESGLPEITLPSALKRLSNNTFHRCEKLRHITLPADVNFIGGDCFRDCLALEKVTVLATTPPTLETDRVFDGSFITDFTIYVPDAGLDAYKTANNWSKYANIIKPISSKN